VGKGTGNRWQKQREGAKKNRAGKFLNITFKDLASSKDHCNGNKLGGKKV